MPLQATSGAASYDAFGGGVPVVPNYIEDVFSTWLYTGNGSTQTINNGIDLAGKGGLVWLKNRGTAQSHRLLDTDRGIDYYLSSDSTSFSAFSPGTINSFNANGFSLGTGYNTSAATYASWTFREAPKFFDVVTYTGNSVSGRQIAHNLGSAPGCMIIKRLDDTTNWAVYHRSIGATRYLIINSTAASGGPFSGLWNDTDPSSTTFTLGNDGDVNANGSTYVAYLFAHNAGGFGLSGTDNVISCGSFTTDANGIGSATLGYEPQFLIAKRSNNTGDWNMFDNMRGMPNGSDQRVLLANTSGAEFGSFRINLNATGFTTDQFNANSTFIYIAIRRGPMKTPTTGTSVFSPVAYTGTGATNIKTDPNFPPDLVFGKRRAGAEDVAWLSRLTGTNILASNSTVAQSDYGTFGLYNMNNVGYTLGTNTILNGSGSTYVNYVAQRAPGFMDVVCYTGTGVATTQTHNLGVVPELMIVKRRTNNDGAGFWAVYSAATGATKFLTLNAIGAENTNSTFWNNTAPTSSVFTVGTITRVNGSGETYVAYLFASCPGVQSIQSFVGDGTTGRTINCGFTGGARFVCIKATSTTGSWWTFDSARGIVTNNDPALQLNSTAAEVTSADAIDTAASGFIVNQEATCSLNASGVTYLVWAIA